jgi:diguanylate cyclase (GGDEF)-like protein
VAERQEGHRCAIGVADGQADMAINAKVPKAASSLNFRILASIIPIVILMVILGGAVFSVGLSTVSHYANERIQEDLERNSRELYNMCDSALQNLLLEGHTSSDPATRLRKGNTLGKIEEYARQHDLEVLVYQPDGKNILLQKLSLPSERLIRDTEKESEKPFVKIAYQDKDYYARQFDFNLWDWRIVVAKDGKSYADFAGTIMQSYWAIGGILFIVSIVLVLYFRRAVHAPIRSIIASIQSNGLPSYKGIYEFEFLSDIIREAKLKEQEKQIEMSYQASHDELTGLINRREFERCVQAMLDGLKNEPGTHAILYLDLDQFKIINDTCGHHAGDALLLQLSGLLKGKLRQNDALGRLGGDEFGVLLRNCPAAPALRIAEVIRQTVAEFRFVWKENLFSVGVSVGLLSFSDDHLSLNEMLSIVDGACYLAKEKGRNRIHVYQADDGELSERKGQMNWVAKISKALEENRMLLYRQTILPLQEHGQKTEHFELLLRMRDEDGKLLSPMAFLPAAERYNLMPAIDFWVIKNAFRYYKEFCTRDDIAYTCSINLSGSTVGDERLITYIHEQFDLFDISPKGICFEITETAAIANLNSAVTLIYHLKQIGCRFALDDFGSGMSSFGYLKTLPVDYIKIDGSFVKDMLHDRIDHAMVEAINKIGHVMEIKTIAEFVENDEIKEELKRINVNFAQGYGIGRPEPIQADI